MKIDRCLESLLVPEATAADLDHLDLAVGALGMAVVGIQNDCIEDAPQVLLDHPGDPFDGLQTAAYCPAVPAQPALLSPGPADVMPQRHGVFLDGPSARGFQGTGPQVLEGAPLLGAHVLRIGLPAVLAALEKVVAPSQQRLMLLASYLVHGVTQVLGNVKLIEGDLLLGPRDTVQGGTDKPLPHVHGDALNGLFLLICQAVIERHQALLLAILRHMDDVALFLIGYHCHVVMALAKRGLVDPHTLANGLPVPTFQPPANRPLHDAIDGVPAQAQLPADRTDRRLPEPVDHQGLEQGGETASGLSPGDLDHTDLVLRAIHPGHLGDEYCLVLAGIQVPPFFMALVVARCGLIAVGAAQLCAWLHVNLYRYPAWARLQSQIYVCNPPRALNAKDLLIEVFISHNFRSRVCSGDQDAFHSEAVKEILPLRYRLLLDSLTVTGIGPPGPNPQNGGDQPNSSPPTHMIWGRAGVDVGLVLEEVKVAPGALPGVMDRLPGGAALGAGEPRPGREGQLEIDTALIGVKVNIHGLPGCLQAERGGEQRKRIQDQSPRSIACGHVDEPCGPALRPCGQPDGQPRASVAHSLTALHRLSSTNPQAQQQDFEYMRMASPSRTSKALPTQDVTEA